MPIKRSSLGLIFIAIALVAAGCSDREPAAPGSDPLAGLTAATRGDTAPAPPDSTPRGAGYFVGTLYGYEPGRDTLETASGRTASVYLPAGSLASLADEDLAEFLRVAVARRGRQP